MIILCTVEMYVCMYVCMYEDSDGLLSVSELRAVLAGFFLEHCHRAIREDAAGLSAALSAAMDPQKSGYITTDGIHTHTYIHTYIHTYCPYTYIQC